MWLYMARRIVHGAVLIFAIMVVTFLVFQVIGDPVLRLVPVSATPKQIEAYRVAHGFAAPLLTRLGKFISGVATLHFGNSYSTDVPVLPEVLAAIPWTALLVSCALFIALVVAAIVGSFGAAHRGGLVDRVVIAGAVSLASLAEFWIGLMLVVLFAVKLDIVPTGGYGLDNHLLLPAITLSVVPMGRFTFFVRNGMAEALDSQYVAYATAMGIRRRTILTRYVLRNVAVPIVALAGTEATHMLAGGAVIVETVFAWPGIGRLYSDSMQTYDLPVVTATLYFATIIVFVINIALDGIYAALDPRVRGR